MTAQHRLSAISPGANATSIRIICIQKPQTGEEDGTDSDGKDAATIPETGTDDAEVAEKNPAPEEASDLAITRNSTTDNNDKVGN